MRFKGYAVLLDKGYVDQDFAGEMEREGMEWREGSPNSKSLNPDS